MSFEDLRIYQESLNGVRLIYELTNNPRFSRNFSLVDQIRRASNSVLANIAEGYGRRTKADRAQFLTIAIGSANEVIAFLDIVNTIYPSIDTVELKAFYHKLGKQIYAFRNKMY